MVFSLEERAFLKPPFDTEKTSIYAVLQGILQCKKRGIWHNFTKINNFFAASGQTNIRGL